MCKRMGAVLATAGWLVLLTASPSQGAIHNITVGNNFFSPLGTVAQAGDTVRWTWVGGIPHSTTSDPSSPKSWDSGVSSTAGFTFDLIIDPTDPIGPLPYHCTIHALTMKDTIWVQAPDVTVEPGVDLWMTQPDCQSSTIDFSSNPIPPDFFGPGSDPFSGIVLLQGIPLPTNPSGVLAPTDAIVERQDTLSLPTIGSTDQATIEILALSLVGCQPITVTYGGGPPEVWEVTMTLSSTFPQQRGLMTVTRECIDGGTYVSEIPLIPRLIFTRIDPPPVDPPLVLDDGLTRNLTGTGYWSSATTPAFTPIQSDGSATVDHDLNSGTPDIPVPPSNPNFFAGMRPLPCNSQQNPLCFGLSAAPLDGSGVSLLSLLPVVPATALGAVCLPDGDCVLATADCAVQVGGDYQGDGTYCTSSACPAPPPPGIAIGQVEFAFDSALVPFSAWGRMELQVDTLSAATGLPSGFVNLFTDLGWVVQNVWFDSADGVDELATYFQIAPADGTPVTQLSAHVLVTPDPQPIVTDGDRSLFQVSPVLFNAEGIGDQSTTSPGSPVPPGAVPFDPTDSTYARTQPNQVNVQAAKNQCFPMSIANSLQYLEDRYGLPVPQPHVPGLKGDSTLVGHLDEAADRFAPARDSGRGVWFSDMVSGKFKYLRENGLDRRLVHRYQGLGWGPPAAQMPGGTFSAHGSSARDESVNSRVTWEWICDQIQNGEDVEVVFSYDSAGVTITGGHAVRVFACGKTLGVPWVRFLHGRLQTNRDPGDSLGLETVQVNLVDLDGDGILNFGSPNRELRFALSESADNDKDGITDGLDNAPNLYNPGQEDLDGNNVPDVLESPYLQTNQTLTLNIDSGVMAHGGIFPNPAPSDPLFKEIWFEGTATNPSATDTVRIGVGFGFWFGATSSTVDTVESTVLLPGQTREIFGGYRLEGCPDSVTVLFTAPDGPVADISGILRHLCYGFDLGCCIDNTGNVNCDAGDVVDIADLTALIDYLFINFTPLCCPEEANINGDAQGTVDIADLTALIDHLFINFTPTAPCQ